MSVIADPTNRRGVLLLVAIGVVLVVWLSLFPWTGEGDSATHYINLLESTQRPFVALFPWSRPGYVLLNVLPASVSPLVGRLFAATVTVVLCWQTRRLADDVGLARAWLAPLLLIAQPLVFQLASDFMTELPMALGLCVAVRLWLNQRRGASCLVVGFLPLVRPEGFFIGVAWGVLCLLTPALGTAPRRLLTSLSLAWGVLAWMLACALMMPDGDPLTIVREWSWPTDSRHLYGRGHLLHHVLRWPYYAGPALLTLFLAGLRGSMTRRMALPWLVWLIVFVVHSVLWWRGWMGSQGLMRIQCCTAFTTALVCLHGWNVLADRLPRWIGRPWFRRAMTTAGIAVLVMAPVAYYVLNPESWQFVHSRQAARFVFEQRLLDDAPAIFFSDLIAVVEADAWQVDRPRVHCSFDREEQLRRLEAMPLGAVGVWDNQRGQVWHGVSIGQLESLGFEVLYRARFQPPMQSWTRQLAPVLRKRPLVQESAVLRRVKVVSRSEAGL